MGFGFLHRATSRSGRLVLHRTSYNITVALTAILICAAAATAAHGADDNCEALRGDIDQRLRLAGLRDPRHHPVPGTRWLRTDRFLHDALERQRARGGDPGPIIEAMAARDRSATGRELRRLARAEGREPEGDKVERLERCRQQAVDRGIEVEPDWQVPDAYRTWQRVLGGYVLARPFLSRGAQRWRLAEHRLQREQAPPEARLRWEPAGPSDLEMEDIRRLLGDARAAHALGWPWPDDAALWQLARRFAPTVESPSTAVADRIGRLYGRDARPAVDTTEPTAYFEPSLVRFGDEVLLQLSYTFWFPERTPEWLLDPYAGPIDGLIWRVTLGPDGRPLLWDSIHTCGCYYTVVIPRDAPVTFRNPQPTAEEDPLLLIGPAAGADMRFTVSPGGHFLRWPRAAAPEEGAAATGIRYTLRPYAELLDAAEDRPPFRADGILRGTSRLERLFLWPAGIPDPGAMRSNGHHATAFLGRRHFDDPQLASGLVLPASEGP